MNATHMSRLIERLRSLVRQGVDRGASVVEYALLVALIATVCVGAVSFLGREASTRYNDATVEMFHSTP
jgi:Flp pilus assembly pilin Flp